MKENVPQVSPQDLERVAAHALTLVPDRGPEGVRLGLGSGRAAAAFVRALGARVRQGLVVRGVPTSDATAALAREVGIAVIDGDRTSLELTVDGADEVDPRLDMIKGYGGALVRERIVAAASAPGDPGHPGQDGDAARGAGPAAGRVIPFARPSASDASRPSAAALRSPGGRAPFVTDNGNLILDCGSIAGRPAAFERAIRGFLASSTPGCSSGRRRGAARRGRSRARAEQEEPSHAT
jgi:ribose 5-phosphate isomerase A